MFLKILTTLTVIVLAYLFIQKQRRPQVPESVRRQKKEEQSKKINQVAYIFIGVMVLSSAVVLFFEYQKNQRILTVNVINTNTGEKTSYKARKGDIDGRSFITVDGDTITLADIERMELKGRP